jgi:molybdopterin-binding protein
MTGQSIAQPPGRCEGRTGATRSWGPEVDRTIRFTEPPDRKERSMKLSARNQLSGTVSEIRRGEAIANVVLDVAGQRLVASITVEAVEELGLAEGSNVTAVIKASDVILATD